MKGRYKMNGAKMSKKFFFQLIGKRLEELTEEVEKLKADGTISFEERLAKENILLGRVMELSRINSMAMDVDYWKHSELDTKITALMNKI